MITTRTVRWSEDPVAVQVAEERLNHPVGRRKTDDQLIMATHIGHVGRLAGPPAGTFGHPIQPIVGPERSLTRGFDDAVRPLLRKPRRLLDPRSWFRGAPAVLPTRYARLHRLVRALQQDQDGTPQCVAYTKKHWELASPIGGGKRRPPAEDYARAKELDGWPGADGTTGWAMLQVAEEQGMVESSWWWTGPDDDEAARDWLLYFGSLWNGADWTEAMFRADPSNGFPDGLLQPGAGPFIYGHETLVLGANTRRKTRTILNSWGRANWGVDGRAEIPEEEFSRLMIEGRGDLVGVIERRAS